MSWKPPWFGHLLPLPSYECFSEGSSCSEQVTGVTSACARLNLSLKPLLPGVCGLNLCNNFLCTACLAKSIRNWTCRTGELVLCFCWSDPCFWVWQICGIKETGRFKTLHWNAGPSSLLPISGSQQVSGADLSCSTCSIATVDTYALNCCLFSARSSSPDDALPTNVFLPTLLVWKGGVY